MVIPKYPYFSVIQFKREELVRFLVEVLPIVPRVAGLFFIQISELMDSIRGGVVSLQLVAANSGTDPTPRAEHIPVK